MNMVMNLWVPYNAGKFLTSRGPVSFSRRTLLYVNSTILFSDRIDKFSGSDCNRHFLNVLWY